MKNFLLSILCLFCIMSYATADEAKFDFTKPTGLTPSITDDMFTDGGNGALQYETSATTFTANGVTINTTNGSAASRIWKSAKGVYDFRIYNTATMTIAAPEGSTITAIAFTGSDVKNYTVNTGTIDGKNWSGTANKIVFTYSATNKINDITVTFSTDGSVTPDPEEPEGGEGEDNGESDTTFSTIAEVLAAGAGEAATKGTVVATYAKGFLMSDATGSILVYLNATPSVTAGDVVNVSGTTSMYGDLLQFGAGSTVEKTGTATVTHPTVTTMDGAAMDAYLAAPYVKYVEYTGTLTISSDNKYYNVAIEDASKAIGSIQYPQDDIKSTLVTGSVIKVTGYLIGVSSSKYVNTMAVKVEVINGGEKPETPTETKEYTVTEALAAYVDGQKIPAIVKGYIVGAMNSTGYVPEFGTTTVTTNILLSDNADETDIANCIIVQLPSGSIRNELNLVDTPDNYKKQIKITGSIEKYFQQAGFKNPTAYEFTGVTGIDEVKGEPTVDASQNGNVEVIYDLTGRKVETITKPGIYIVGGKKVLVK